MDFNNVILIALVLAAIALWYFWPKTDENNDGKIDLADAKAKADVNGDGKVNTADAKVVATEAVAKVEETVAKAATKVAEKAKKNAEKRKSTSGRKTTKKK
jgi:hypothetical protein